MDPLTVVCATRDDLAPLHQLVERAYRGDSARQGWTHEADLLDGQRTDAATLAAMLDDPRQHILVARDGAAIIGCVAVTDQGNGTCYLGLLAVDPARQAGGLGRQLIKAAEESARRDFGARRIEMTVIVQRPALIAWYERRGYRMTGEQRPFPHGDTRFGVPRSDALAFVVLARDLD
ncbi:GNAT family N-acetyltransferase [Sphingomonas sp. AR_OL41]|uniref:GNAT family N-acetyltransferase n=1 Tax=Sphingomonas sp. AR_OL41 TaxID=3042729 RepID=UPI0024810D28|nr:GNAT family N-acetyltransferase [Sphingomonas sp. AR_OL41]MDH7973978.1 GNAT family N-acetyltransferase [Sphingomonas sp. AR_OL41]